MIGKGEPLARVATAGRPTNLLIVGGHSQAALAFRRLLARDAESVSVLVRRPGPAAPSEKIFEVVDYFQPPVDVFAGVDAVVNFAGVTAARSGSELMAVNAEGPRRLAELAKRQGVRQFVQISSLSIYGDAPDIGRDTQERPASAYGRSKMAADRALLALADATFTVSCVRVPILYGRSAGTKLHRLARAMRRLGWWPAPAAMEHRSVLHVDNLSSALLQVIRRDMGGILFAADPEPFSLQMLADVCSAGRGRRVRLVGLPELAFAPLRVVAAGTYRSLYGRSLIDSGLCLSGEVPFRSTRDGLVDLFATTLEH